MTGSRWPLSRWRWRAIETGWHPERVDQIAYHPREPGKPVARLTVRDGALTYIGRCDSLVVSRPGTPVEFDGIWALHATAAELDLIRDVRGGADVVVRGKSYQLRVLLASEGFSGSPFSAGLIWPISLVSMEEGARGILGRAIDLWLLGDGEYVDERAPFLQFGRLLVPRAEGMLS